jgi:hypothetical protein
VEGINRDSLFRPNLWAERREVKRRRQACGRRKAHALFANLDKIDFHNFTSRQQNLRAHARDENASHFQTLLRVCLCSTTERQMKKGAGGAL